MVGSAALNGGGDDLPGFVLGLVLCLLFDLLDLHGGLVADVVLHGFQQVLLGLILRQPGDLLQRVKLLLFQILRLRLRLRRIGQTLVQLVLFPLEGVGLFVKGVFLLLQAALLLGDFRLALFHFLFVFRARFMDFVLGFQKHFLLAALSASDRLVDDPGRFILRRTNLPFAHLLAVNHANGKEHRRCSHITKGNQCDL